MKTNKNNAVIYLREQSKSEINKLLDYAKENGLKVLGIFKDDKNSNESFDTLLSAVETSNIKAIITYSVNNFSSELQEYVESLQLIGIEFHYIERKNFNLN